jgi:phasin family protein
MYATPNQFLEIQKNQIDALQAFGATVLGAAERLAQLHVDTSRGLFQQGTDAAHTLLSAKDPQDATAIATTLAQPGAEKLASYSKSAYAIASSTYADLAKTLEAQVAEGNRKLTEFLDAATKTAPAGSEYAFGLVKSTLSAANTAFDAIAKAARQASETAESNIAAVVAVATESVKAKGKKV